MIVNLLMAAGLLYISGREISVILQTLIRYISIYPEAILSQWQLFSIAQRASAKVGRRSEMVGVCFIICLETTSTLITSTINN